jgi:LacI family transcriptional regulator
MPKVKIGDIARESGVSISTVSLILNNKPGISDETRARVLKVASQLGYPLKSTPSADSNGRLTTIGMVVKTDPDITPQANPFYSKVLIGIEDACRRSGINLLFATLPVDENNRPLEIPQLLYHDLIDGLLMIGTCVEDGYSAIPGVRPVPIVLVDGYSSSENFDTVVSDNFRASYQAVEHLIHRGHRHIGLAGSSDECYPSLRDRRNGYLRALKEHQISDVYIADFNINRSHGVGEITALLEQNPHITALFCVNDDIGSAAIRAAQSLGRRMPDDLSIIGYDDTYIAASTHPALTTMHVDTVAMGRAGVHLLALRLENPNTAYMTLTIHPRLIERESVCSI